MNKKAMIFFWVVFAIFLVTKHGCQQKVVAKQTQNNQEELLLDLHNKERKSKSLNPLEIDRNLCLYAQRHADRMASRQNLNHSKMTDLEEASGAGRVAENIAYGQETEDQVVKSWMGSFGHKRNILNPHHKHVGFGSKKDKEGKVYWCVVFTD